MPERNKYLEREHRQRVESDIRRFFEGQLAMKVAPKQVLMVDMRAIPPMIASSYLNVISQRTPQGIVSIFFIDAHSNPTQEELNRSLRLGQAYINQEHTRFGQANGRIVDPLSAQDILRRLAAPRRLLN